MSSLQERVAEAIADIHCSNVPRLDWRDCMPAAKAAIDIIRPALQAKWEPIETYDEKKVHSFVLGAHSEKRWVRFVMKFGASGWYQTNSSRKECAQIRTEEPTHWMPVPNPPEGDK